MGSGSSHAAVQPRLDLHYGYSAVQGFRAYQEDRQTIHHPLSPTNKKQDRSTSYFACYDGHGGDWTSEYLSLHLHKFIAKQKEYTTPNKEAALMKGFLECDRALLAAAKLKQPSELSGSTAVVALIDKDYVYIASTGDSRCAICRTNGVEWLTTDHKPQDPEEYKRIVAAGGKINKYAELGDRGLAVSRAFGDAYFKSNANLVESQQFIIVTPSVSKVKRGPEDQFLMLATDGLWNVMTHTTAAEFIQSERKRLRQAEQGEQEEEDENKGPATDRQRISERELLHELAAQLTQKALDLKSRDNVSAVIVDLSAGSRLDTNEFTVVQSNNRGSGPKNKGRSGGTQAGYKSPAKRRSGSVAVVMDPVTIDSKADSTVDA